MKNLAAILTYLDTLSDHHIELKSLRNKRKSEVEIMIRPVSAFPEINLVSPKSLEEAGDYIIAYLENQKQGDLLESIRKHAWNTPKLAEFILEAVSEKLERERKAG